MNDEEFSKKYHIANKRLFAVIKNSKATSVDKLLEELTITLQGELERLQVINIEEFGKAKGKLKYTFIELQKTLKFAEKDLMKRLQKTIKPFEKITPMHTIKQSILNSFVSDGILSVNYASGATIKIEDYAKMTARTARSQTDNTNAIENAKALDTDLVFIPPIAVTCQICTMYQGRVYSISGKSTQYPALYKTAFRNGYNTIHPNCRHRIVAYFEEQHSEEELNADRIKSNRPLKETKENVRYKEWQEFNRQVLRESTEYDQLKKVLGDRMPYSTLGGFRRAVRQDTTPQALNKARDLYNSKIEQ